jgi:hypothetical protein
MSRQEMSGCIPIGAIPEYVNEANKAVMHLFTGGKAMGNRDLYFAVIYFIAKDMECLENVFGCVKEQLVYRMDTHFTSASLSGMSNLVGTKLKFKEAIWFVLASGSLYTDNSLIPLRQHAFVHQELLHMNSLNGYPLSEDDLSYINVTVKILSMLHQCKKDPYFNDKIRAQYQHHIKINDEYVFLDRAADCIPDDARLNVAIANLVSPNKSASEISVQSVILRDLPIIENYWDDGEYQHFPCTISMNTCRPLYMLPNNVTWMQSYTSLYTNSKRMLSMNKYYGHLVCESDEYPSMESFLLYMWKREKNKGSRCLPHTIEESCRLIMKDYEHIINHVRIGLFKNRFRNSVSIEDRKRIEKEN